MARSIRIKGLRDFEHLRPRSREAFLAAGEVISEARRGGTTIAAEVARLQREGVRVSGYSVKRYFAHDLERGPGGRLVPKPADRSYHGDLQIISTEGKVERAVRGSRARTLASDHANAVQSYLRGRDPEGEGLQRFRGRRVAGVELATDLDQLDELQRQGEFDDFTLYLERGL
jgi:hypothetical protein